MIRLLATDLDRTLLPNGAPSPEGDCCDLPAFFEEVAEAALGLMYVSGRTKELLEEAYQEYDLIVPDYFGAAVGTKLYKKEGEELVPDPAWAEAVHFGAPGWERKKVLKVALAVEGMRPQEESLQNEFKISLYLDEVGRGQEVKKELEERLAEMGVGTRVIFSVDPLKNVGLVDILPEPATKLSSIEFVRERLGLAKEEVVYAGDSGNDILPLTAGYFSILVGNARPEVVEEVQRIARENRVEDRLYLARAWYSEGIREGLRHFGIGS